MDWLSFFKGKKEVLHNCFICGDKSLRKDCVEVKYRYGSGSGQIGSAYMCNKCNTKYNGDKEDDDYVEPI